MKERIRKNPLFFIEWLCVANKTLERHSIAKPVFGQAYSDTPEATEVPIDTPEATEVTSETPVPTETMAATVEDTATPTLTETGAAVDTETATSTPTLMATQSETASGTDTSTPTLTATETQTETATATQTAILAGTPTEEPPAPFTGAYYIYDGDDNMVMSVINGITTYYASSSYVVEVDGSDTTVRKTYSAGSTSLAVRTIVNGTENTLNWMLSDHLGSSSITTTADGTWNSEIRYSAFGETRYSSGITPTDYRYTGQLEQADVNLYYYNARYYDAALGRFVQADTIIPGAGNSRSYDRYAYVSNNPCNYTDPSGHCIASDGDVSRFSEYPYGTSGLCSDYEKSDTYGFFVSGTDTSGNDTAANQLLDENAGRTNESYGNMVPLANYRNALIDAGIPSYLYGLNGVGDKEITARRIKDQMLMILAFNPDAKFFMMGHSGGADTVALAISFFLTEGGNADMIIGAVLADSSIIGNNITGDYIDSIEYPNSKFDEAGTQAFSQQLDFDKQVLILKSKDYPIFGLPDGMLAPNIEYDFPDIPGIIDDHHALAVDSNLIDGPYGAFIDFTKGLGLTK